MRLTITALVAFCLFATHNSITARADDGARTRVEASIDLTAGALLRDERQARAAIFVLEEYLSDKNDLDRLATLYTPTPDYFDRGLIARAVVLEEKRAYFRRWPIRRFTADLETLSVTLRERGVFDVWFEADFHVSNGDRSIAGRSLIDLTVAAHGEGFMILREAGQVLERY